MVDDQDKALRFDTDVLGFEKSKDVPVALPYRWITVVSPEGPDDLELVLEPNANPAGKAFQTALFEQGIPARRSNPPTSPPSMRGSPPAAWPSRGRPRRRARSASRSSPTPAAT